jgi:hypothetical protein
MVSYERDTSLSNAQLVADGFEMRFLTDEPRLSESVELYESLGFEVLLRPMNEADLSGDACTACMRSDPDRFRFLYTRKTR